MPFGVRRSDAEASRPQQGAVRSIDMPSARITCNFPVWARSKPEHRQSQAVSNSVSQTVASEHTKTSIPRPVFQPLFSSLQYEAYIGSGENDKRYRRQHPAS